MAQDWGSKFVRVGLTMTTSTKVQMPSLVNTMSFHQWEELNVFEKNACSYHPMCKPASHIMASKVL